LTQAGFLHSVSQLKRQLEADKRQHRCQTRTQDIVRNLAGQVTADVNPRQRSHQQVTEDAPIHVAHAGVPHARDQRQRHRVSDFGTDQAAGGQERVEDKHATVPKAPAPMEVRATMVPRTNPVTTVNALRLGPLGL